MYLALKSQSAMTCIRPQDNVASIQTIHDTSIYLTVTFNLKDPLVSPFAPATPITTL